MLASGTTTAAALATGKGNSNIVAFVAFVNCASFTNYISEINKTQIYNAKGIDVVMLMENGR